MTDNAPQSDGVAGRILDEALARYPSQYHAVLPYNLNWMLDGRSPAREILAGNPLTVMDIGARGGHMGELEGLREFIVYHGFDADSDECARLNAAPPAGFVEHRLYPYYVGATTGPVEFHIYRQPGESSRLKPDPSYRVRFHPQMEIERSVTVDGAVLDDIVSRHDLRQPDILKLDTQGTEFEILASSPRCLSRALLVEVEVEFVPMYEGQKLFHDICALMYGNGFELFYLNRVFQNRWRYAGEARGQHTFADALFGRRDDRLDGFALSDLARYAVLLVNYGYLDIAHDLWLARPELDRSYPALKALFSAPRRAPEREALMTADKALCRSLHQRRTNQLGFESDRSWPIR